MALADDVQDVLDKMKANSSQWFLVAFLTFILLRQGLSLIACALPVIAYMYLSNRDAQEGEAPEEADDGGQEVDSGGAWPPGDEDDEDDMGFRPSQRAGGQKDDDEVDPYDQSFWDQGGAGGPAKVSAAPWRNSAKKEPDDDFDFGPSAPPRMPPKDDFDNDDDLAGASVTRLGSKGGRKPMSDGLGDFDGLGGLGGGMGGMGGGFGGGFGARSGGGGGLDDDFDFLGGRDDDRDFMPPKGRGKGKGDKGKGKDPNQPREANPKQVFVANVGDMEEEEIQQLFEEVGEVDRLKVLRAEDGSSKGVGFVTFRTEDQAQEALKLHGRQMDGGRNLVVRLAHGGNKGGDKGDKGDKGGFKGDRSRGGDRFGGSEGPVDLGGSERFGAAFGFGRDRDEGRGDRGDSRGFGDRGGKGGKGKGKGRPERGEMDEILEDFLANSDSQLRPSDFDFAARRFLTELKTRDHKDGTGRLQEALDMVMKYTKDKERSAVRKWPAYVFTLLTKFDTALSEELRERDAARKAEKGGDKGGRRHFDDDD